MRKFKNKLLVLASLATVFTAFGAGAHGGKNQDLSWSQWAKDAQHTAFQHVVGQTSLNSFLANQVFDENAAAIVEQEGFLLAHYQVPLTDANGVDVYMSHIGGNFVNISDWGTQTWSEKKFSWVNNQLVEQWEFVSDWIPVPFSASTNPGAPGPGWEPVFHAALSGNHVYIPGFGGTIFKVSKATGELVERINPFGEKFSCDNIYVSSPISVDNNGNIYYTAIKLDGSKPWDKDVVNSWLVKVSPNGGVKKASFASLVPGAPAGTDICFTTFSPATDPFPWPPAPDAVPRSGACGTQRPAINAAVGFAPDGTIYAVTRAHLNRFYGYVIAVNPDLTPKWQASLRDKLNDGCNVVLPANGQPGGCSLGAKTGVDPRTNMLPAGEVLDDSTSSPSVGPDGSVYYGAYTRYNWAQGHTFRFDCHGKYLGAFEFGWDITPAIHKNHNGSYSIQIKENHYGGVGSYCNDPVACPANRTVVTPSYPEEYFITQLSPNNFSKNPSRMMPVEWRFKNTSTDTCNTTECETGTNPNGFEWCINAVATDKAGNVYANSEDGYVYIIKPDGTELNRRFLNQALGAAYTPLSLDSEGRLYTENFGNLIVLGN